MLASPAAPPIVVQLDEPDAVEYPLGEIGIPPVTEPAEPVRIVDLDGRVLDEATARGALEGRVKLGSFGFAGGEVSRDRFGAFFDTQRTELGVTKGRADELDIEGSFRAPFALVRVDASRRADFWTFAGDGSIRLSPDWEVLASYAHDTNEGGGGAPSLEEFIETSRLPAPELPTRRLRSGALGFVYQRENQLELEAKTRVSRVRAEAGFELTRKEASTRAVWNRAPFEIDGVFELARTGRTRRFEGYSELGASLRIAEHVLVHARTMQQWQPGVDRALRDLRFGATFFARRYRFARSSEAAARMLELSRRANALGYNERRIYDTESLRAFRERLSISSRHQELADAIDGLYLAQVRERNVPTLGLELTRITNELLNATTRGYRAFLGIPWPPGLGLPISRNENLVEFIRIEAGYRETRFPSVGVTQHSYELSVSVELNREHIVSLQWTDRGQSPEDIALRIELPHRFEAAYVYALGR